MDSRNSENNPKVVAMVQVRMSSTRLPKKALADINGHSSLWHHVNRLRMAKNIDQVVVSTTDSPDCDVIEEFCVQNNFTYYRGDEVDVLDRLYKTAVKFKGDILLRVTGDCPLVDPKLIDEGVDFFKKNNFDFVKNNEIASFPHGLDFEVFSFSSLEKAWKEFKDPELRALATFGMYHNNPDVKVGNIKNNRNLSHIRITLDYPEDLELIRIIFSKLESKNPAFGLKEIVELLSENSELNHINDNRKGISHLRDAENYISKEIVGLKKVK